MHWVSCGSFLGDSWFPITGPRQRSACCQTGVVAPICPSHVHQKVSHHQGMPPHPHKRVFFPLAFLAEALCQQTPLKGHINPSNSRHLPNFTPRKTRCCSGCASITRREHRPAEISGRVSCETGLPLGCSGRCFPFAPPAVIQDCYL